MSVATDAQPAQPTQDMINDPEMEKILRLRRLEKKAWKNHGSCFSTTIDPISECLAEAMETPCPPADDTRVIDLNTCTSEAPTPGLFVVPPRQRRRAYKENQIRNGNDCTKHVHNIEAVFVQDVLRPLADANFEERYGIAYDQVPCTQ